MIDLATISRALFIPESVTVPCLEDEAVLLPLCLCELPLPDWTEHVVLLDPMAMLPPALPLWLSLWERSWLCDFLPGF